MRVHHAPAGFDRSSSGNPIKPRCTGHLRTSDAFAIGLCKSSGLGCFPGGAPSPHSPAGQASFPPGIFQSGGLGYQVASRRALDIEEGSRSGEGTTLVCNEDVVERPARPP